MGSMFSSEPLQTDSAHLLEPIPRRAFDPNTLYLMVLFIACTTSGGVILGTGAFSEKAVTQEKLLTSADMDTVANVAFQMLTFLSLVWSILHDSLGPRGCACLGLLLASGGHLLVALSATNGFTSPYPYAVGLGLVGGCGMGAYISSFQFLNLQAFHETRGIRTSLLAAAFNVAAYPLLLLNIKPLSLDAFFYGYGAFALLTAAASFFLFPDSAYDAADTPRVSGLPSWWCCCKGGGGAGSQPPSTAPRLGCSALIVQTWRDLKVAFDDLKTFRFWGFCLSFSWAALTQEWAGSGVGSGLLFKHAGAEYYGYAVPLLTNATYLFAPLVGWLIDRTGFFYASLLLVIAMQVLTAALWLGWRVEGIEKPLQWISLILIALMSAVAYTIQYAYLTMTFKPSSYPGLLTSVFIVQGSLGFLALPASTCISGQPNDECTRNFMTILAPSAVLYAWPLWELFTRRKRRGAYTVEGATAAASGNNLSEALSPTE